MEKNDNFSRFHPINNFFYFTVVFVVTMFFSHPVCRIVSFCASIIYNISLGGKKTFIGLLKFIIPVFVFTAILSPLFSHAGMTIITYLPSGNPLTVESIFYGLNSGVMFCAVIVWFSCFSKVITTDKYVYLFGRILPVLSLLISLTLRFIPLIKQNFQDISETQNALENTANRNGILNKTRSAVRCFSMVLTSCLEHAADVAVSMKCRGYGTKRRTAYSIYRFEQRDKHLFSILLIFSVFTLCVAVSNKMFWRFYPDIRGIFFEPVTVIYQVMFFCILIIPAIIDKRGDLL